ncbi:MAG: hydantoinase/oxoprolinase family protein [Gammaproteobacteria bacterium]|nr:hydantoinase/oxoprolinase family protein [Gammaproteobacteria bacterium]MDH5800316.1 hydantoinase/oxoprolinase family protein [Gammaproteobacteria bacterium]
MGVLDRVVLGVDTGGTFTDFVLLCNNTVRIHKVLSTPKAPELAILQGMRELGLQQLSCLDLFVVHGSTVATNAVLEGKGVRTAYITNYGLGDVLSIGRQARKQLYNLQPPKTHPPVPKALCLETGGRLGADASVVDPLSTSELQQLRRQLQQLKPEAVAVNLLFSFLDDRFEQQVADIVPEDMFVSLSSQVLPECKEYERGISTWLNACVGPIVAGYLQRLCDGVAHFETKTATQTGPQRSAVSIMQSAGGTIAADQAALRSVELLLSGPAGGLSGAQYVARYSDRRRLLTFDMGGTSTDVALIDGDIVLTSEGSIGDYPVGVPQVDMHTIGAGGGSIAMVDEGGILQVGPQSAGADPGPACYGKGGQQVTVTDANLVLGRLRPDLFLGGGMTLDVAAAQHAIQALARDLGMSVTQTALGVIQVVNEHMARALRVMSVQRGLDPKSLTLVSFGGAGGLHVCALAEALAMPEAIVPVHAGVLSALGMLVAPRSRQLSQGMAQTLGDRSQEQLTPVFEQMRQQAAQALLSEGLQESQLQTQNSVDLRYTGQSYALNVPWLDAEQSRSYFEQLHLNRYGHKMELDVELVTARTKVCGSSEPLELAVLPGHDVAKGVDPIWVELPGMGADAEQTQTVPVLQRQHLGAGFAMDGPLLITETVSTTYVQSGWRCRLDDVGNILLARL